MATGTHPGAPDGSGSGANAGSFRQDQPEFKRKLSGPNAP